MRKPLPHTLTAYEKLDQLHHKIRSYYYHVQRIVRIQYNYRERQLFCKGSILTLI